MVSSLFESLREKAIRKKIPIIGHFDLTYRCNLKCVHCYIVRQDRPRLTTFEIKDILKQLADAGVLYLTLSGGEILTREDFFEIASYARELNFVLRLLTNGTLVDKRVAEEIAMLRPELVAISIYSTNPEVHDEVTRISSSLQKSISATRMLRKRGIKLKLSTVIMKQNIKEWRAIYKLAQKLGARFQADYRIAPKTNGDRYPLQFHISDESLSPLLSDPVFAEGSKFESEEEHHSIFDTIPCGAGHMSCYISPYGDVYPCVQLPINCGNLGQKSFREIWENSPQMSWLRSLTLSDLPCFECDLLSYCRPCIGLNYIEEGNVLSPPRRICKEAKIARKLGIRRR